VGHYNFHFSFAKRVMLQPVIAVRPSARIRRFYPFSDISRSPRAEGIFTLYSMPTTPIRIVIVDDHALLAELLGTWIARYSDLALAGRAGDGEAGWKLCQELRPDLALVDVDMPKLDGLGLVNRLIEKMPAMRLITMTGRMDPFTIWRVSQSGVHGYLEKTLPPDALLAAVRTVAKGGTYYSPVFQKVKSDWLSQPEAFQKILSDREQEILRRVVAGWSDELIGKQLDIAASTVGVHRKNIRGKLELHNDRELVAYAREWGLDAAISINPAVAANPP
jgi:DNA-binding NarL/FixJ family response regulator